MNIATSIDLELLGPTPKFLAIGIQVITALILGGLVGMDRETKLKAAGLKTNILICIGATLYTTISMLNTQHSTAMVDPNRVAAQIVSGIGFLGAGAIMQARGSVIGLTTAATIWVVAAIGYTIGAGYIFSATLFTLTVLVVLKLINPINSFFEKQKDYKYFHIEILSRGSCKKAVNEIIFSEQVEVDEFYEETIDEHKDRKILHVLLTAHPRSVERIVAEIAQAIKVEKVNHRALETPQEENIHSAHSQED